MKVRFCWWSLTPFLLLSSAACGAAVDDLPDAEIVGAASTALEAFNAMNPNAMNPNAMNPSALRPSALARNVLREGALAPEALAAIQEAGEAGALSRQLLKYAAGCALDTTQLFQFSWTDALGAAHEETYRGLLGLAPSWTAERLDPTQQQWVSACIAARANWYGVSVIISSRAEHPELRSSSALELATYGMEEGAFWGNLFADPPRLYACHHEANRAHSRRRSRDCAAGHVDAGGVMECGIIRIVGACHAVCDRHQPAGLYWASCRDEKGEESSTVVTTFLR